MPSKNHISRYLYKNNDDSWRPLYVKIEDVKTDEEENIPAEYVGWEWVKANRYNLSAAVQTIAGSPELSVSNDADGISFAGTADKSAKFKFERADFLDSNRKFATYHVKGQPEPVFQNSDTIDLFQISDAGKYLTVLDKTEFTDAGTGTVANTQLGWRPEFSKENADSIERARQMFAIVRNYVDGSISFLPVAFRKWKMEGESIKYDDTLSFNLSSM